VSSSVVHDVPSYHNSEAQSEQNADVFLCSRVDKFLLDFCKLICFFAWVLNVCVCDASVDAAAQDIHLDEALEKNEELEPNSPVLFSPFLFCLFFIGYILKVSVVDLNRWRALI
jgi:hypothetical protein